MNFGTESDAGAAEQELLLAIRSKITTKSRAKAIFVVAPSEQAPSKKIINLTGGGRISIFYEPWLSVSEAKLLFDRREKVRGLLQDTKSMFCGVGSLKRFTITLRFFLRRHAVQSD